MEREELERLAENDTPILVSSKELLELNKIVEDKHGSFREQLYKLSIKIKGIIFAGTVTKKRIK